MSKFDPNNVEVLNYNQHEVYVSSAKENYKFNASKDGKTPAYIPLTMAEIKWICNNTDIFQCGILTFEDAFKKQIFEELRVHDWENILTNDEIKDIILHPSVEGVEKLLSIDNVAYFDRVKTICFILVQEDANVATKMRELIEHREIEFQRNIRKTKIEITKPIVAETISDEKLATLEEQNASLQAQLDEMKTLMKKMMANNKQPKPKKEEEE